MRSKAAIAGHPIHPALVAIPIGLFTWTLVADVVYLVQDRDQMWYNIACWSGIAAIVSAAIAALPGLVDYFGVARYTDARGMGMTHMVLNTTVTLLFIVALLMMLDNGATDGTQLGVVVVLHAVGVGLLLLSGWLGGEMVFRKHIGSIPEDAAVEREERRRHAEMATPDRP